MKYPIPILCLLILFIQSCDSNKSEVDISMQIEIMKDEPVSNEYFEAIAASTKMMAEENAKAQKFQKILRDNNETPCQIDSELLEDDPVMEKIAETQCRLIKSLKALHDKYPFIKDMSKENRKKLFAPLLKKAKVDIEKIKQNIFDSLP